MSRVRNRNSYQDTKRREAAPRRRGSSGLSIATLRKMPDATGRSGSVRPWGNMAAVSYVMRNAPVGSSDLLVLMAIAHESEPEGPELAGRDCDAWGRKLLPRG